MNNNVNYLQLIYLVVFLKQYMTAQGYCCCSFAAFILFLICYFTSKRGTCTNYKSDNSIKIEYVPKNLLKTTIFRFARLSSEFLLKKRQYRYV